MSERALEDRLNAEVAALGGRIYPLVLPQKVRYPAAVYQRITATRTSAFGRDAGPVEATIQVDVYSPAASGYGALATVAAAVRGALQRWRGPSATPPVLASFIDAERDEYEDATHLLRKSFEVRTWYTET